METVVNQGDPQQLPEKIQETPHTPNFDLETRIQSISGAGFFVLRGIPLKNNGFDHASTPKSWNNNHMSSIDEIVQTLYNADILLLGECHDDTEAHRVELDLLKRCYSAWGEKRQLILSLEMFERDVQPILDEFMSGAISERDLLHDCRPWLNYSDDYRPLLHFAKDRGIPAIAANAPRRYVSLVGNAGRAALSRVANSAAAWLPPLPYAAASADYTAKFDAQMAALRGGGAEGGEGCPYIGWSAERSRHMLDAQVPPPPPPPPPPLPPYFSCRCQRWLPAAS
jgi:hypothetical protein